MTAPDLSQEVWSRFKYAEEEEVGKAEEKEREGEREEKREKEGGGGEGGVLEYRQVKSELVLHPSG